MVTIDHIAEATGVSKMTVSRILNGRTLGLRKGSAERADRIREVAMKMGYRPHAAAIATRRGRFDNVALVVGGTRANPGFGWMPQALLSSVSQTLAEHDLSLSLADAPDDLLTDEQFAPRILRHWAADGLLMNYIVRMPKYLVDLMERHKVPTIWMNVKLDHDCVHPDDVLAGTMATRHMLELGHRKIAFVGPLVPGGHYSGVDRLAAYQQVMTDAGLPCREFTYDQPGMDHQPMSAGSEWLQQTGYPTAVVVNRREDGFRLLLAAAKLEQYREQPLSLVGFNNEWDQRASGMPTTVVQIPFQELGRRAVEMLLKKISRPEIKLETELVPPTLVLGETSFPCR